MSTNESGPPDDGGGAPAYGAPPAFGGSQYVVSSTPQDDIPIFTLNDIVAMLTRAQEKLQETTHTVFHKSYTDFHNEAEKQARAALSAEMAKFYRDRGVFR